MTTSAPAANTRTQTGVHLPGLDGTNPLGFLAALGLFRVLVEAPGGEALRMIWAPSGGIWAPRLRGFPETDAVEERILDILGQRLVADFANHPGQVIEDLDAVADNQSKRRKLLHDIASEPDQAPRPWAAAVASDFASADSINQLQTTRRDYFIGNLKSVIGRTSREHLRRSIFQPWDYADALDNQSLHLDPGEDRRHAYQWNKPAGDPERKARGGMLGANRLALEAIPLFTSIPDGDSLRTLGFTGNRSTNTRWTWPLWDVPLSLPVARSLLAAEILQREEFDQTVISQLRQRGVCAVYRTRRILVGKTPNFTPAQCLL